MKRKKTRGLKGKEGNKSKNRVVFMAVLWKVLLALLLGGAFLVLSGFTNAVTVYSDDFSALGSTPAAQYYNLSPSTRKMAGWSLFSGGGVVQAANPSAYGASVTYQVQNAKQITVGIFDYPGIMAGKNNRDEWIQGSYYLKGTTVRPEMQVKYSPSEDNIYLTSGGKYQRAIFDGAQFIFEPTEQAPGDLVPFGVSVSYSMDGIKYQGLSLGYLRGEGTDMLYYEELATAVPAGASHIRVSINSISRVLGEDGYRWNSNPNLLTLLGKVEITGENMWFGLPEVSQSPAEIDKPPEASSALEPEKKEAAAKKKTTGEEGAGAAEKSPAAAKKADTTEKETPQGSPKFEGNVVADGGGGTTKKSSSKASKAGTAAKSSKSSKSGSAGSKTEAAPVPDGTEEASAVEPLVYEVAAKESKTDPLTGGVLIYVFVVAGVVLFILLRPKRKSEEE